MRATRRTVAGTGPSLATSATPSGAVSGAGGLVVMKFRTPPLADGWMPSILSVLRAIVSVCLGARDTYQRRQCFDCCFELVPSGVGTWISSERSTESLPFNHATLVQPMVLNPCVRRSSPPDRAVMVWRLAASLTGHCVLRFPIFHN